MALHNLPWIHVSNIVFTIGLLIFHFDKCSQVVHSDEKFNITCRNSFLNDLNTFILYDSVAYHISIVMYL